MKNKLNLEEAISILQSQITELESRIRNIEDRIQQLINDYNSDKLSASALAKQILDIKTELARLNEEIAHL